MRDKPLQKKKLRGKGLFGFSLLNTNFCRNQKCAVCRPFDATACSMGGTKMASMPSLITSFPTRYLIGWTVLIPECPHRVGSGRSVVFTINTLRHWCIRQQRATCMTRRHTTQYIRTAASVLHIRPCNDVGGTVMRLVRASFSYF